MTSEARLVIVDKTEIARDSQYRLFLWFADSVISDAVDSQEMRLGLSASQTVFSSLRNAKNLARHQLGISSRSKFRSLGAELENYQDSQAYRRLGESCNDDPERRVNAIIKTVSYIIPKVLETIPRLVQEANPEDLFVIANASYSLVDEFGANEGNYFNSVMTILSGQDMYEAGFDESIPWRTDGILVIGGNGLDFSGRMKQRFPFGKGNNSLNRRNKQGALWSSGDKSSVRRLHSWFVDQVAPSYEQSRRI